ncbi:hypothetical protein MRB53_032989 [Persea americana]|uniref:Uncharacterized protein n=2 Tax=Persea americana TaxID=3435 RepID=A0ACC2KU07_PERAE|nr:hypothetical protein MRB53_032988 [Persea americana]KAJ8624459.1 hypothetical protein MRB53_032989 [Persea americana]
MAASNGSEFFEIVADGQNEHFPRPSNAESVAQDEDELIWAAIERLPSQERSNYAIIRRNPSAGNGAPMTEAVDVRKLDRTGRELLLMKAMATNEQDNYNLLSGIKERLNRRGSENLVSVRDDGDDEKVLNGLPFRFFALHPNFSDSHRKCNFEFDRSCVPGNCDLRITTCYKSIGGGFSH